MKAMIFAAGKGTRLGDLTINRPKALVPINRVPVLEYAIKKLMHFGFNQIIINIHHFGDQVITFLKENDNFGIQIEISDERSELLDTGGGLKKAAWFLDKGGPFLVYNVDVLTDLNLKSLYEYHLSKNALATLATRHRDTARYLLVNSENILCGWQNIKTGEIIKSREDITDTQREAFSGIQVISPEIFKLFPKGDVFPLMGVYLQLASEYQIGTFNHDYTRWLDIGKPESIMEANSYFRDGIPDPRL